MPSDSKFSVLLVDDDATSTYLTTEVITQSDAFYPPIVFAQPERALDYLQQQYLQANQALPQLLLIDINMPELNGFELIEKLQQTASSQLEHSLLCLLSSSSSLQDKLRARALGIACYYEKPLKAQHRDDMLSTLKNLV